ncbi:DUF1631 family protein [Roseateles flavus]|uniref:DUF1631 family protein n=1 Tax=Roseateles flavus TaxID=3149041 RepID=A0ABV0GDI4_9BURK
MSNAPSLQSLVDEVIVQMPSMSHSVAHQIQDDLKADPLLHALQYAWAVNKGRFATDFQAALQPLLESARRGEDPLQRRSGSLGLQSLSLVDEKQALQDVSIAHVVSAVEEHSRPELHQLVNFFAALRGIARPMKQDNPLRPAVFANALVTAIQNMQLDGEGCYAMTKVATPHVTQALSLIYQRLCDQMRSAQLAPLVEGYGIGSTRDIETRLRQAAVPGVNPTLDTLARRVDAINSRPQALRSGSSNSQALGPNTLLRGGGDLLTRLYDQILADPKLLPPVKALMSRLQVAVARLSRTDPSLLRRQDHPVWSLLNRVAAHGAGFQRADDERLRQFLDFMNGIVQQLVEAQLLTGLQFQQALGLVDQHIREQASRHGERSASALAALEREGQRVEWLELLQGQLREQLSDTALSPTLRKFLLKPWVEVIVQNMVLHGREAPEAQASIELVDELLDSLQQRQSEIARTQLRSRLPGLIKRIEAGMDLIAFPADKRQVVLQDLMNQHGRVLSGLPAHHHTAPQDRAPVPRRDLSPEELLQQLLNERESQMPSRWAHDQVNRGELPTVPVGLYSESSSPDSRIALQAWMGNLQVGNWYHMFVQSQWITAQIAWISESRQFFLFVGQDADERHSLTRGAIEQLLANGLITALEEDTLVQRAVSSLMQDLDDAP